MCVEAHYELSSLSGQTFTDIEMNRAAGARWRNYYYYYYLPFTVDHYEWSGFPWRHQIWTLSCIRTRLTACGHIDLFFWQVGCHDALWVDRVHEVQHPNSKTDFIHNITTKHNHLQLLNVFCAWAVTSRPVTRRQIHRRKQFSYIWCYRGDVEVQAHQ